MKRIILALGLAGVLLLFGGRVYAQHPDHKGMHSHESMASEEGHSVTPEQAAKFRDMRRTFIGENAQLIGSIVAKKLELRSLWTDPKADPKAILDKENELRALQDQMRDKVVQAMLEARKDLTPEQIAHWKPWKMLGMHHRGMMRGGKCGGEMPEHGMMRGGMMHGGMMGHGGTMRGGMMGPGHEMGERCTCGKM